MKTAVGTKVIRFEPMSSSYFDAKFRKDNGYENREGYHVQYDNPDGSVYDSWSPKNVFDEAYRSLDGGLTFWDIGYFLDRGKKVARIGWNGKGMWLKKFSLSQFITVHIEPGEKLDPKEALNYGHDSHIDDDDYIGHMGILESEFHPLCDFIGLKTADGKFLPWNPNNLDMLAKDYCIVE